MPDPAATYASAVATVTGLVARIPAGAWTDPGLGAWDVRALVGHTSRSLVMVLTYFDRPAAAEQVPSAAEYYARLVRGELIASADAAAIVERGRQAGTALGDDPAAAFAEFAREAVEKARGTAPDALVETIGGGMRVDEYLRTRVFELVVHGLDIAAAVGGPLAFAEDALVDAVGLAAQTGVRLGHGPAVLRALTGRQPLPEGFCVV